MHRTNLTWLVVGAIAWTGVIAIAAQLASAGNGSLGFDLELLLQAGRDVAAGRSPYAPALLSGTAPDATSLFYSYPPPIAQALAPFAAIPSEVMHVAWVAGGVIGLVGVSEALRRRLAPGRAPADVAVAVVAGAPLVLPFSVALLFGNFDVWFPTLYGLMLLGAVATTDRWRIAGGIALTLATLKVHPTPAGVWFLVRGRRAWVVAAAAVVTGALILATSLVVGGIGPWVDYSSVVRATSAATIVDPRNAGPAAMIAAALGGDDGLARTLHLGVVAIVLAVTAWAARRRPDPIESFAWAATASLATLPVTWYHYPSALLPIAVAILLRSTQMTARTTSILLVGAGLLAALALIWLPLLWGAMALVILAARASVGEPESAAPADG